MAMDDKELPKINMHGHLRRFQDIRQRLRIWDEWNVQHFCCLCLNEDVYWNTEKEYFTNDDFLKIKDEYGDRILGFAAVALPTDVLEKIYWRNAARIYPRVEEQLQKLGYTV